MALNRARGLQVVDPFLTNVARRYKSEGFVADELLPGIPVKKLSGQYPVFDDQYWFSNDVDNKGSDRDPAKEIDYAWSLDTYLCEEYKLKVSITDLEEEESESELRLRQTKTEFLAHRMNLAREVRVAALLQVSGDGGGLASGNSTTPSTNWDQDAAAIEADIKGAALSVYDQIGITPNTLVIPFKVAYAMAVQEDIRAIMAAQIAGGSRNFLELGDRVLPAVIHGMRVVIPKGQISTAKEGAASPVSKSEIWGDDVRLLWVDKSAKWGQPSVAYDLVRTKRYSTRWRTDDPEVEYTRQLERRDEKVTAPNAGWVLKDTLS